ncbi:MAG TPA: MauE/DoxX family redox-associated membrane protein [Pseudonocardia sp.]|nr:MauE/DoxX family redox-associated membrane protein [Pseudonocardia sp.]
MPALFVPYVAAAVLLLVAGIPKAIDPEPTRRAASGAGLPSGTATIRAFGVAEAALGAAALLLDSWVPAALVALTYAGFAAVVARGLVRGDMESCGCFNGEDSPPSVLHVVVDAGLAAAALGVALSAAPYTSWWALATADLGVALTSALLGLTVAALVYLVLAKLPRVEPLVSPEGAR